VSALALKSLPAEWQAVIGGFQDRTASDYSEPAGGWRWLSGEHFDSSAWCVSSGNPSNSPNGACGCEDFMTIGSWVDPCWNDVNGELERAAVIEWSADCNGDGIVDYGQILGGQLLDANQDGVPGICQCPGDITRNGIIDGIDLAAILGAWGTNGQGQYDSDINNDGIVDGADLAFVLGGWGPCTK
jgi:hypothetical protein